jgi:hypothetical protein
MTKPHPSKVFGSWKREIERILRNPSGPMLFPMHVVHYTGRDESGRFRAFDVMLHGEKEGNALTFGETRADSTEPKSAVSSVYTGMYVHFHMKGYEGDFTLEKALADFAAQEKMAGMARIAETFTVGELQEQMVEVVRQLIQETGN